MQTLYSQEQSWEDGRQMRTINISRDIRFLMLLASPQMKVLGEDKDLTVGEFARRMRAEWRRGSWQELDKTGMIFHSISYELRRELKLRDQCQNAERMLEVLHNIQGDDLKLPELKGFEGESVKDFSRRLYDIFEKNREYQEKAEETSNGRRNFEKPVCGAIE